MLHGKLKGSLQGHLFSGVDGHTLQVMAREAIKSVTRNQYVSAGPVVMAPIPEPTCSCVSRQGNTKAASPTVQSVVVRGGEFAISRIWKTSPSGEKTQSTLTLTLGSKSVAEVGV